MKKPSILRALRQPLGIPAAEFGKGARIQRLPDARGELTVKIQVVHDRQTHGQHLLGLEQVVDVGAAVAPANRAVARRIDRPLVALVLGIF